MRLIQWWKDMKVIKERRVNKNTNHHYPDRRKVSKPVDSGLDMPFFCNKCGRMVNEGSYCSCGYKEAGE